MLTSCGLPNQHSGVSSTTDKMVWRKCIAFYWPSSSLLMAMAGVKQIEEINRSCIRQYGPLLTKIEIESCANAFEILHHNDLLIQHP